MKPGPNLLDVSDRRTHEWLVRWIQEPDKMLEEKDPTAIQLFESYNRLPMPNLRVSEHEAEMLLDFIKVESKRMKKVMEVQAIADQQEVEPMDCCQKNEEIVLKEESGPSEQEFVAANPDNDSSEIDTLQENLPTQKATATPADTSRRSPLTLISWASGVGLSLLAIRSRKRSEQ